VSGLAEAIAGVFRFITSLLPMAFAWLAGRRGAEAESASKAADVKDAQLGIAADRTPGRDDVLERLRSNTL
jgi:hypothetical protein